MPWIAITEIEETAQRALMRHGADGWIAIEVARAIARAEETGNVICGLYYLESYCQQLGTGRVKGSVEPQVTRSRPGSVQVDARFGFAQPAFARALPEAIAAAREAATRVREQLDGTPRAIFLFNCHVRDRLFGERNKEEIKVIQDVIGKDAPLAGFYTYAEQAPLAGEVRNIEKCKSELHNETVVIFVLGD